MLRTRRDCYVGGALALTLHVSRVFGMAPLQMTREHGKWRVSYSKAACFYSHVIVLFLHAASLTALGIELWLNPRMREQASAARIVWIMMLILVATVTTIGLVGAPTRMKEMIEYLNIIEKVCTIASPNDDLLNGASDRNRCIATSLYILAFNLFQLEDLYYDFKYDGQGGTNVIVSSLQIAFHIKFFIMMILEMQFVFISLHVYSALKFINDSLNDLIFTLDLQSTTCKMAQEKVRCLILSFGAICDVIRQVAKSFEMVLIFLVGTFLFHFVVALFSLITTLIHDLAALEVSTEGNRKLYVTQLFLFIMNTSHLLIVFEPGYQTEQELERTSVLVSQLQRRVSSSCDSLTRELDHFIKQIALNKVSYTPLGLCTLSRPLIASICGVISTYVIIILQLQDFHEQN